VASNYKIDRLETTFTAEDVEFPFTTLVFATKTDSMTPVVFEVSYADADGVEAAILASPTVDGGEIVDFLP